MLVLSRKQKDCIVFPQLDITIEVLQTKGSSVKIGVDAPVEISVIRGELEDSETPRKLSKKIVLSDLSEHEQRNRLNGLTIATGLAKLLIEKGKINEAANRLESALEKLGESVSSNFSQSALLVEDSSNEREMLAGFLRLHGMNVAAVSDGLEAIDYLEANVKPDFILIDMTMPRLDGPSTITRIRDNPAFDNVEIFAISGHTPQSAKVDVTKNRISEWFQKPLRPNELIRAIQNQIDVPESETHAQLNRELGAFTNASLNSPIARSLGRKLLVILRPKSHPNRPVQHRYQATRIRGR